MKASDYIVRFLEAQGIEYVFGYQGGMITHLVDSLYRSRRIKFIQCYHEQSAAFAAEGYARASGKFGVCITTSGPGATNAITSIGNAYFDSIPVLYITGQVNSGEYKYNRKIRQLGFQETDIVSVVRPISKWAKLADSPDHLATDLKNAVSTMLTPRMGPALIDLPMDVQRAELKIDETPEKIRRICFPDLIQDHDVTTALAALASAKRPFAICGGGLSNVDVQKDAGEFLARTKIPYAVSLMGKGLIPENSDQFVGMVGCYGNRAANLALSEADVVLCIGTRLDSRQTGRRTSPLLKNILFIRIDIDAHEILDNQVPNQIGIVADVADFFHHRTVQAFRQPPPLAWMARIRFLKNVRSQREDVRRFADSKVPYEVLEALSELSENETLFVADIGQNQMWAAQTLRCGSGRGFLTSGGMAPMAYAIPAAVGAAFANPERQIVCICGDGGFHMALQSLMLISQYALRIAIIVFNNHALGMITQFQRLYFNGNLIGTSADGGYLVPDIAHLATAYGIPYRKIRTADALTKQMLNGPIIIEVEIDGLTSVVPKLEFNRSLDDMTPSWPIGEEGR